MDSTEPKVTTTIRVDASILEQIRNEAKLENRSLSNYIETLLYKMGYGDHNEQKRRSEF